MAGQRSDLMLGLGLDASGALKEAQRLADKMRQELGGAGAGGARSADEIAQALKRATDAANSTGRAMGGIGPGGAAAAARSADDLADALRRTDADATRARGSLDDLTGSAKELAIGLAAGIGAALAGGALAGWIGQAADAADEVARLADQTGISAEKLSAWGNVAQRNGQDLNDLAELTTEMSLRLSEIDKDSEGAGLALKNLGLDYKALAAMPAEEAFEAIARSVASTENSGRKTALVMAALGDEAQKYITTLNTIGAAGQMEAIVTAQQAAAAREYKDALNGVSAAGAAWSQSIVAGILPALSEAARALDDVMSGTGGLTSEARRLAQDGTITEWARGGVIALTYLADAGIYTGKVLSAIAKTAAAAAVQIVESLSGIGSVAGRVLAGDFAGAAAAASGAMARVRGVGQAWAEDMDASWSERTLGAKIRDRIGQTKAYTAAAQAAAKVNVSGRSMVKQEAPKAGQGSAEAVALAKAQAQAALVAEVDATNAIRKELERRHSLGLDASGDYYQQLADLAARESKAKLAAIDAEAAAEKARSTKDPAGAKQSEARLIEIATKRAQEVAAAREKAADIGAQADREALDESRRIAQEWAQSWQSADKLAQQYAGASAKAQAAMIVDPLERARAEARIAAQQIADDGAQMMTDLGNQIDTLSGKGLTAQADALRVKLDQIREGIKAEQSRTIAAPDVAMVADYLGKESPGQRIAEGFDAASQSLSAFVTGFQSLFKVEENYSKAISARGLTSQQIADIEAKHSAEQINAYGTMAGAAKGMFKSHTAGFKIMAVAEKAFRAVELAMAIKSAAVKMGLFGTTAAAKVASVATETGAVIAGQGVETGAVVAGESARNTAKVPGVFMSYMSMLGPFGMAAAGAAVAAVLGGAFGSKGSAAPTSADRQASQGTGTVLGDDSAKSKSIGNSLDRLRDVNTMTMQYSAQMLASLRGIEAAMAGVSTQILRAGGVTTGKNLGINTESKGTGDAISSLLSSIPLIGGVLGGVVGGIVSGIFGKSSSSITDAGLSIGGTAAQMQQGQGVSQYADKTTTKKSWFSSSTKTSTVMQDAGADVARQFGLIFGGVSESLQSAAGAMGQDAAAVAQRLAGYVINIPRLSLQGLKGDDLQEAISTAVGAKADEMARLVAPGLVDFQRIGEGYFETVVRVASATESAGETLRRLGVASVGLGQVVNKGAEDIGAEIVRQSITTLEGVSVGVGSVIDLMVGSAQELADTYKALRSVRDSLVMMGVSGAAVSRAMIAGAGGLDQLSSGVTAFEEGFFSESERAQMQTARMAAEFGRLGVAMPETRAGFRSLVTGIDTSTEAGQRLVGELLPLSAQFSDLVDATSEAATAIQTLTDAQRQQVAASLAQLGIGRGANADMAASAAGGLDALQSGISAFEAQFYSSSERFAIQSARLADQFRVLGVEMPASSDGFRAMVSGIDASSEAGSRLLGGLLPLSAKFSELVKVTEGASAAVEMLTAAQRKQVKDSLSQIGVGGGANSDAVSAAAGGLSAFQSGISAFEAKFFSDSERFAIQSARLADQFKALGVAMPTSADEFRGLVSGVDATSEAGSKLLGGLLPLSGGFADLMDRMGQLKTATGSLGKGVEDEVARIRGVIGQQEGQSIAGAQTAFALATAQARAGDTKALDALPGLSQAILKAAEDQSTTRADLVRLQAQTAASLQTTLDTVRGAPEASAIAAPVASAPGVIATATQAGAVPAAPAAPPVPSGGSAALLIELQSLRTESAAMRSELQAMRQSVESGLTTVATNTGRSARILDRVTAGGDTIQTEVVTP